MKASWAAVMLSAARIRSPSFSRILIIGHDHESTGAQGRERRLHSEQ
jgi:hypothetical protein